MKCLYFGMRGAAHRSSTHTQLLLDDDISDEEEEDALEPPQYNSTIVTSAALQSGWKLSYRLVKPEMKTPTDFLPLLMRKYQAQKFAAGRMEVGEWTKPALEREQASYKAAEKANLRKRIQHKSQKSLREMFLKDNA